jgi:hypothetical protein
MVSQSDWLPMMIATTADIEDRFSVLLELKARILQESAKKKRGL